MKAPCRIMRQQDGTWAVRHSGSVLDTVEVSAASRDDALAKMRDELQYRFELCPCSGVSGDTVVLEVLEENSSTGSQPRRS